MVNKRIAAALLVTALMIPTLSQAWSFSGAINSAKNSASSAIAYVKKNKLKTAAMATIGVIGVAVVSGCVIYTLENKFHEGVKFGMDLYRPETALLKQMLTSAQQKSSDLQAQLNNLFYDNEMLKIKLFIGKQVANNFGAFKHALETVEKATAKAVTAC